MLDAQKYGIESSGRYSQEKEVAGSAEITTIQKRRRSQLAA